MSKFCVKKPYTVLVGIVMVLVLGFISFTRITTDLLPSILCYGDNDLPGGDAGKGGKLCDRTIGEFARYGEWCKECDQ